MARLTVTMIYVVLQASYCRLESRSLPWKIERGTDGDSVAIRGAVLSAVFDKNAASTEESPSGLHVSETQAGQHVQVQSLFGRQESNTDNPDGAVVKVHLLSELQVEPNIMQLTDNQSAAKDSQWMSASDSTDRSNSSRAQLEEYEASKDGRSSLLTFSGGSKEVALNAELQEGSAKSVRVDGESALAQSSDDRPSSKEWPWQAVWESAGDGKSKTAAAPENGAEGCKYGCAGETEHAELRARKRGQREPLLSKRRNDTDNPDGLVVGVTLNSELQEGDGRVKPLKFNTRRLPAQDSDDEAETVRKSGLTKGRRFLKPVGDGTHRSLTQLVDGRSNTRRWLWDSVWNSAGDNFGRGASPSPPAPGHSARTGGYAASTGMAHTELRTGEDNHKWTLGRKPSESDNPKGAVMEVTLNSELQEGGGAVEPLDVHGQSSFTQVSEGRSITDNWPWSNANTNGRRARHSRTHAQSQSASMPDTSGSRRGHAEFENLELSAGKFRRHQWSLGRKQDDTDNAEGAVMSVTLNSELQQGGGAVKPLSVHGQPSLTQVSDGRFTTQDDPRRSANDGNAGSRSNHRTHALTQSSSGSRRGHADEVDKNEFTAGRFGRHSWSLGRKQDDTDNPEGAIMKVTLNSELQDGVGTVQRLDVHRQPFLMQVFNGGTTTEDWPWHSASDNTNKPGSSKTHSWTHSISGSRGGHAKGAEKKKELSAGKLEHHPWSLGRKPDETDNAEGAVMEVTLNSELQEVDGVVEPVVFRGIYAQHQW